MNIAEHRKKETIETVKIFNLLLSQTPLKQIINIINSKQRHKNVLIICENKVRDKPNTKYGQSFIFPFITAYSPYAAKGIKVIPIYSPSANLLKALMNL